MHTASFLETVFSSYQVHTGSFFMVSLDDLLMHGKLLPLWRKAQISFLGIWWFLHLTSQVTDHQWICHLTFKFRSHFVFAAFPFKLMTGSA